MKINISLLLMIFFISTHSYGQKLEKIKGNKDSTIEEFSIDDFKQLTLGETFKITLKKGDSPHISITTDSNLHDVIEYSVIDSTLTFHYNKRITSRKKPIITVTFTESLSSIELKDKSQLEAVSKINSKEFLLTTSENSKGNLQIISDIFTYNGSRKSKIELDITTELATLNLSESSKLKASISATKTIINQIGRSNLKLDGKSEDTNITISNRADFMGALFVVDNCKIFAKDNANAQVQSLSKLTINANGNSKIYIFNNPKITIEGFNNTASIHKKIIRK